MIKHNAILEVNLKNLAYNYKKLSSEIKKSKASIIFHLAAQPLVRYSYLEPKETFDTNFTGTLNIMECIKNNKKIDGISEEAQDIMTDYHWPGNVREIKNVIERAVVLTQDRVITQKDLPGSISSNKVEDRKFSIPFGTPLREIERKIIVETLKRSKGDKEVTAKLLGITPRTIYRKMNLLEEEEKREELNKEEAVKEEPESEEARRIREEEEANDNINS